MDPVSPANCAQSALLQLVNVCRLRCSLLSCPMPIVGMMGKWWDDSACRVVHDVRLSDTVVISGDDVCCSVVFGTLVCV